MQPSNLNPENKYDSRWFIWTIVFLVVTGISLISYIVLSDNGTEDVTLLNTKAAASKSISK